MYRLYRKRNSRLPVRANNSCVTLCVVMNCVEKKMRCIMLCPNFKKLFKAVLIPVAPRWSATVPDLVPDPAGECL